MNNDQGTFEYIKNHRNKNYKDKLFHKLFKLCVHTRAKIAKETLGIELKGLPYNEYSSFFTK